MKRAAIVAIVAIVALALTGCAAAPSSGPSSAPAPAKSRASGPVLSLVSTTGQMQGDAWFVVSGMVKNLTDQPLANVQAVVIVDGAAEEAVVSYNPIKPGETSPFKVLIARKTPADKWQVQFKQNGQSVPSN